MLSGEIKPERVTSRGTKKRKQWSKNLTKEIPRKRNSSNEATKYVDIFARRPHETQHSFLPADASSIGEELHEEVNRAVSVKPSRGPVRRRFTQNIQQLPLLPFPEEETIIQELEINITQGNPISNAN